MAFLWKGLTYYQKGHSGTVYDTSPHMHVVGVPVGRGFKRGLSTKVSKRSVFTPQVLSEVLQDKMRADANHYMKAIFQQELRNTKLQKRKKRLKNYQWIK
jgi:hypothetical protein